MHLSRDSIFRGKTAAVYFTARLLVAMAVQGGHFKQSYDQVEALSKRVTGVMKSAVGIAEELQVISYSTYCVAWIQLSFVIAM